MLYNDDLEDLILNLFITYNYLVPISMFMCLRIVKLMNSYRLRKVHKVHLNSIKATEDLGQIEYILTDKTGTITTGEIQLKICVLNYEVYIRDDLENFVYPIDLTRKDIPSESRTPLIIKELADNKVKAYKTFSDLKSEFAASETVNSTFYHFVMAITMCNSSNRKNDKNTSPYSLEEKIMIETAKDLGVSLVQRIKNDCVLIVLDQEIILRVVGYQRRSHNVKKSRIIVKEPKTGQAVLYVGGSRDTMLKVFAASSCVDKVSIEESIDRIEMLDKKVVMFGYRLLTSKELEEFEVDYLNSRLLPVISEEKIEDLFLHLEQEIKYLGAVGIEELMLESTRDAIKCLSNAGIKFWMLSGDNEENTICSGISSGMFKSSANVARLANITSTWDCTVELIDLIKTHFFHMNLNIYASSSLLIRQDDPVQEKPLEGPKKIQSNFEMFYQSNIQTGISPTARNFRRKKARRRSINPVLLSHIPKNKLKSPLSSTVDANDVHFVLSIDKSVLEFVLNSEENRKYFAAIVCAAECVCFHSLLPDDKAKVVYFLRYAISYSPIILAIGDGSCDVGMIEQAHVGVGIIGSATEHSGNVAVRDFSQLKELLLYEGHTQLLRMSKVIYNSYYINYMITFILFFYCNAGGSGGKELINKDLVIYYLFFLTF